MQLTEGFFIDSPGVDGGVEVALRLLGDGGHSPLPDGRAVLSISFPAPAPLDSGPVSSLAAVRAGTSPVRTAVTTDAMSVNSSTPESMPILSVAVAGERPPREVTELVKNVIKKRLESVPGVGSVVVAGSFRRMRETVGDLDILVSAPDDAPVVEKLMRYENVARVLARRALSWALQDRRRTAA